jgi:hypothetical protein
MNNKKRGRKPTQFSWPLSDFTAKDAKTAIENDPNVSRKLGIVAVQIRINKALKDGELQLLESSTNRARTYRTVR